MSWESQGAAFLAASLLRPFALAVPAWLFLRAFRVRHPASQHAVWTAVLLGILLLPVVSVMAPQWKLPVPPRKYESAAPVVASSPAVFTDFASPAVETEPIRGKDRPGGLFYMTLYLAGLLAIVTYRVVGWALLRRVISRSTRLRARLWESTDVVTPVAVGVLGPVVILPAGWRTWNVSTRRAVLAHEFAHLRRHDTLVSALARLVPCVFWFYPLTWWISRKISELAELACDAVVLERVDDPAGYARILMEFADAVSRAGRRVSLPGLAMAAGSGMDRRIEQVFELSGGKLRKLWRPRVLLLLTGAPVICLAATVGLGEPSFRLPPLVAPTAPPQPLVIGLSAGIGKKWHSTRLSWFSEKRRIRCWSRPCGALSIGDSACSYIRGHG